MATISQAQVLDYQAVAPRKRFRLDLATRIPMAPTRLRLATVRIRIRNLDLDDNRVELLTNVGVRGVSGISQLLFRVFRNGVQIFTTQQGVESAGSERNYTVTFQTIDRPVRTGTQTYTVTVENRTAGTTATVVGPLSFSALAIRRNN